VERDRQTRELEEMLDACSTDELRELVRQSPQPAEWVLGILEELDT
jgi:hypothetical protein